MSKKFKLGVIGNPIEHSLSPFIHSRFARQENINLDYQAYKVNEDGFHSFINEFFADSLAKGLNVTLPFKKPAAEIEGTISDEAKQIDAVNTISQINNKLFLDSTDGIGFIDIPICNIINERAHSISRSVLISSSSTITLLGL